MKKLLLFFSCFPGFLSAQYNFNFEDSTLNLWYQVPSDRWIISNSQPLSGGFSLQHGFDNSASGCDIIEFRHDAPLLSDTIEFSFRVRHGYNPSSSNNWQVSVFNTGDTSLINTGELCDGIYLGVNLKGSDDIIKLWQVNNREVLELLNTGINYQESVGTVKVPIFRLIFYPDKHLELFFDAEGSESQSVSAGVSTLSEFFPGRSFLIRYSYSSSQDRKLWFDDFQIGGSFYKDRSPPRVISVSTYALNVIGIEFNEPVETDIQSHFFVQGIPQPVHVDVERNHIKLTFPTDFKNRVEQSLKIQGIKDVDDNILQDTTLHFISNFAEWGDLVINEIMFDPSPSVYLPECEYVELYNRSDWNIIPYDWSMEINGKRYVIQGDTLYPDTYVLLTGESCYSIISDINDLACFTSGSALANSGGEIALFDQFKNLIHVSRYGPAGEDDSWKSEGGWAIERIDPEYLCGCWDNMDYSTDYKGGTPGKVNSISRSVPDEKLPIVLFMGVVDTCTIRIHFSELLDMKTVNAQTFLLKPGDIPPDSVVFDHPWFSSALLYFPFGALGKKRSELHFKNVSDCVGNFAEHGIKPLGLTSKPGYHSLLITEVMYDPEEGAPEFIELYNYSSNFLDLADVMIGISDPDESPGKYYLVSEISHIVSPGEYIVVTKCVSALMDKYNLEESGNWVIPGYMPGLVNSGGVIYLTDRSGNLLDYMSYKDEMHMSMIDFTKGISLERISFEADGHISTNWHSAASIYNYSTPGSPNSQYLDESPGESMLSVSPGVFSPDNDGFEDVLKITLHPGQAGYVLQMDVVGMSGERIRSLANNDLLGTGNIYFWDGRDDTGSMVFEGLYLLHALLFHPESGESFKIRKAFGLIYR